MDFRVVDLLQASFPCSSVCCTYNELRYLNILCCSERKHRKKQQLDGQSDFSGSLKFSDGTDDRLKEGKLASSGSKNFIGEQVSIILKFFLSR